MNYKKEKLKEKKHTQINRIIDFYLISSGVVLDF